jgi:hypothetical protein
MRRDDAFESAMTNLSQYRHRVFFCRRGFRTFGRGLPMSNGSFAFAGPRDGGARRVATIDRPAGGAAKVRGEPDFVNRDGSKFF